MNSSKIIENKNVPTTNYNYPIKSNTDLSKEIPP